MPCEIHPEAWSIIDPEFRNAFANRPNLSKVAERNAPDADVDPGFRAFIFKVLKLFMIEVRFPNFDHLNTLFPIGYIKSSVIVMCYSNLKRGQFKPEKWADKS